MKNKRLSVSVVTAMGLFVMYLLRTSFSVTTIPMSEEFKWPESTKGYVLSSYFWGYICLQTVGGLLSMKYGGVKIMVVGVSVSALLCFFVPIGASNTWIIITLNALSGLFNAMICPAISFIISKWSPPNERTILTAIAYLGTPLGLAFGQPISGLICDTSLGWRGVYYIYSAVNLLWCVIFCIYVKDSPESDPNISNEELEYIKNSLKEFEMSNLPEENKKVKKHYKSNIVKESKELSDDKLEDGSINISKQEKQGLLSHDNEDKPPISPSSIKSPKEIEFNNRNPRVSDFNIGPDKVIDIENAVKVSKTNQSFPIGKMFSNPGILVIFMMHCCTNWGFYTIMTYLPTYINGMFDLPVSKTSLIIFIPYVAYTFVQLIFSYIGDKFITYKLVRIITLRKLFICGGNYISAVFLVLCGYTHDLSMCIVFMTLAVAASSLPGSSLNSNMMDVSPKYIGLLMGVSNTFGTLPGIISPIITSNIIGDHPTVVQWRTVFIIAACVITVSSSIYACFARASSQPGL